MSSPTSSFSLEPSVPTYRAYRLNASGGIEGVEHIQARDDSEAMALAGVIANGYGVDLWERARYLASFPALSALALGARG